MATPGQEATAGEHAASLGDAVEEYDHLDLVGMIACLDLGADEQERAAAAAAVVPSSWEQEPVHSAYESRFWKEGAAAAVRFWREDDAAPVGRFLPAPVVPGHGVVAPHAHAHAPSLDAARGFGPAAGGAWRHEEDLRRGYTVVGPWNELGVVTPPARPGGAVLHGGHAYMAQPPFVHGATAPVVVRPPMDPDLVPSEHERVVLLMVSQERPEDIVTYACNLLESERGQRLFCLVFMHSNLELREWVVGRITRDRERFWRICAKRSDEVVYMIKYCGTRRSMLLLRDAMSSWMAPNLIRAVITDSGRVKVVMAFMQFSPRDIAQFIFEAVSKNCTKIACQPHGPSLLEKCRSHASDKEIDDIFTKISYKSIQLSQNSCGNYIVQDVLKEGSPLHLAIIASCLRSNYVELSRQKYSSNVVEQCLRVFGEGEREVIVDELIGYPHFRDLVLDEFANFVLSTALRTCSYHLRDRLARAIIRQDITFLNQNCLKIFALLTKFGYRQGKVEWSRRS